jgi:hypothetical protein
VMSPPQNVQPIFVVLMIYANDIASGAHDGADIQVSFSAYSADIHEQDPGVLHRQFLAALNAPSPQDGKSTPVLLNRSNRIERI